MIRHQLRCVMAAVMSALLVAGVFGVPAASAAEQPEIVVESGGWGHGIGMSQYGAYWRAQQGQTHGQILGFYYPGTTLGPVTGPLGNDGDVDVLIDVRSSVAVSRPWVGGAALPGWKVRISAGGTTFEADRPVMISRAEGRWVTVVAGTDRCDATCTGVLRVDVVGGDHLVLEEAIDGNNVGNSYGNRTGAYEGRIVLHPAALGGGCGSGEQFCVIHADLTLESYLQGIAEVPAGWPAAAQQAQAVAARSYAASAVQRRAGLGRAWDVDDSVSDQYYAGYAKKADCGGWCAAVSSTAGQVVRYGGTIAETYYSSSNGGSTVEPPDVWASGSRLPYLRATPDPFDSNPANPNARRERRYTVAQVSSWIADRIDDIGTLRAVQMTGVPPSGRITFAQVTLVGSRKTVTVSGGTLYATLRDGCLADPECDDPVKSSNLVVRSVLAFTDVGFGDYFYLPVQWMTIGGITNGVSPTTFGSGDPNTRAQLATFLWRFAGEPAAGAPHGFADIGTDRYFAEAVAWMKTKGITTGTGPTTFSPDRTVTRAEAATFLWRFAGEPASSAAHSFTDVPDGAFYTEAVRWMVEHGITTGTTSTTFSPGDRLTRAQIATFLWRLAGVPESFAVGVDKPPAMRP